MPEPPVVNASPLVVLARAGRLDLLRLVGERVLVPEAVVGEVRAHSDEASRALDTATWIDVVPDEPVLEVVAAWDLGAGESAVLSCVPKARPLVEELRHAGLYLSDTMIRDALSLVGE